MKIQNAEMNFVMFDTEDVIVTSGPAVGQAMVAQLKTIYQYNTQYSENVLYNQMGMTNGFNKTSTQYNWLTYNVDENMSDLKIAEGQSTPAKPEGDYFYANTVAQIKQWLDFNTKQ